MSYYTNYAARLALRPDLIQECQNHWAKCLFIAVSEKKSDDMIAYCGKMYAATIAAAAIRDALPVDVLEAMTD